MREKWIWVGCLALFLMLGCTARSYFGVPNKALYAPDEFGQTETAVANAEKSEGAKYCPEMIAKAKELGKQGVETYWACNTAKCMDLLAQARQAAKDAESCQPPQKPVAITPAPTPPAAPKEWVLEGLEFDTDKATIRPTSEKVLQENLKILKDNPSLVVEIHGHTDSAGGAAHNMKLSEARANAVKDWMVAHGISADRMKPKGFGASEPIASNKTKDGMQKNRRVTFKTISQ